MTFSGDQELSEGKDQSSSLLSSVLHLSQCWVHMHAKIMQIHQENHGCFGLEVLEFIQSLEEP